MSAWTFDEENSNLLDETTVDYLASPWKLKPNFLMHCVTFINNETMERKFFIGDEIKTELRPWVKENVTKIIGHNIINYDLLVLKAYLGMDYTLGFEDMPSTWDGKEVEIVDTYVLSKTLFPDRPKHSVDYFGGLLGLEKIDWRAKAIEVGLIEANAPKGAEFAKYHPEMLVYNERDAEVNIKIYNMLMKEWGVWDWHDAFQTEQYVAWIVTRQSHRGFWLDRELAIENLKELDTMMESHRSIVEPNLPEKPMAKTRAKEYIPPKIQFKGNGDPSAILIKWLAKHDSKLETGADGSWYAELYGTRYKLPMALEPVVTTEPSKISDSTFIKGLLVDMGWTPTSYKEKDLTLDAKKKKLPADKFKETVHRYVEQTLNSPFCDDRLERVNATRGTLLKKLLEHDLAKPLKVLTNPTFTVGQDKEIDPMLIEMDSKFPYTKLIVEYLTYSHRRNSIIGGGFDIEDEDEAETGFLANLREDGRIPTPADSCGCSTSRFKHRVVCNIPRVTSLYGEPMRRMFGIGDKKRYVQFAYDFASLEAMIQSHYCWKYDDSVGHEYCNSLTREKPFDIHTLTATKISQAIGMAFSRGSAKAVGYACAYGAQAPKIAKTIGCDGYTGNKVFEAYWEAAKPLADLKAALTKYWETAGLKKFILGIDGRKIMTRSKHSLVNALFQSAGVISAKRTMIYQDIAFRREGVSVDFWADDWKNKQYVQQLIAYHDECQMELTHGLVEYKKFSSEVELDEYVKANPEWLVVHEASGYFAGNSIVQKLCKEAVDKTTKHYKLNVNLAIDPQLAATWAGAH